MRTTTSQRRVLSWVGRVPYAAPPAAPMSTVPCLVSPGPICTMVAAEGLPVGEPPGGLAETLPSGVHWSLVVTGRIDSILPQRSQASAGAGAVAAPDVGACPSSGGGGGTCAAAA